MKSATSECHHPCPDLILLLHKHHDATAWRRESIMMSAQWPPQLWFCGAQCITRLSWGLKWACRTAPPIPVTVSDSLSLQFYIVTSLFTLCSATARFPNSVFLLILPLQNFIGFFMLHKLIFSHLKLPCNSSFLTD